jgi:hypothetical protein
MGSIKLVTTGKKPTKTVDTLVPDINKLLVGLANNKKLKISDKQLDGFLKNIKNAIVDWSNPVKQNKSSLRMSIIGRPARQLWYDKHRPERQYTPDPSTQLKFLYGHILEHLILFLTELAGHTVTDQQKKVNVHGIVGHMDSKIDGEVVDVKTASPYSFKKFEQGTLNEDDPFGYIAQLSGYEASEKTNHGGFLAINKSTGQLAFFKPDDLMKPNVKTLITDLKDKLEKEQPPERCYEPVFHEKSGNKKLPAGCVFCSHKVECHKDANEGKGLRAFKYANGKVYFTHIEKEPKVEEVEVNE